VRSWHSPWVERENTFIIRAVPISDHRGHRKQEKAISIQQSAFSREA
jgi:hypothetical protein